MANPRYLSLDLSLSPGFAVLEVRRAKPKLVYCTGIKTTTKHTDAQRYSYIEAQTVMIAHQYGPFEAIIREDYASSPYERNTNKRARQGVFGAWAAVDLALNRYGYAVTDHITPREVKKIVAGDGKASKEDVMKAVVKLLGLEPDFFEGRTDDESDACAVGLAYLIREKIIE